MTKNGEVQSGAALGAAGWELTGNHVVSLPLIDRASGAIVRVGVLHRGAAGVVEWAAADDEALLALSFRIDGNPAALGPLEWERLDGWIPHFDAELRTVPADPPAGAEAAEPGEGDGGSRGSRRERADRLRVRATICAPAGHEPGLRGAVYLVELENRGRAEREIEVSLGGIWRRTLRRVLSERGWGERNRVVVGTAGVVLQAGSAGPGLAVVPGGAGEDLPHRLELDDTAAPGTPAAPLTAPAPGAPPAPASPPADTTAPAAQPPHTGTGSAPTVPYERAFPDGSAARLAVGRKVRVGAGKRAQVAFFLGVGPDGDGALATALYLRGLGAAELLRRGRLELARLARTPDVAEWAPLLNRALFFNYFFALGRAIDDDRFYPVSSRSPLLASGASFRERDALLWSLPAITLLDPWLAREVLMRIFEQFAHRPGEALHYLDGAVLAPGFALDQACAYGLALERYARDAHDEQVHEDPLVQDVLRDLDDVLFHRLHPETFLAATELLPSGGPPDHPYVTYDNVLLWAFCQALPRLWVAEGPDDRPRLGAGADEIEAAIWHDCTTEVDQTPLIAWSVDLQGVAAVYDDPAGSLALLPALGFCAADDPLWSETLEFLRSSRYPFWLGDHDFPGLAGRAHPDAAGLAALCSDLLGPRRGDALELLHRLDLDDGIACEAWNPDTGRPARGLHYAALAGFLGWALWQTLEGPARP